MSSPVKPQMAYPTFASATATFTPAKWPELSHGGFTITRFEADAVTAGGVFIRNGSSVKTRSLAISYKSLTEAERDMFFAPDGSGFFSSVGGGEFEYKHIDGIVYTMRFLTSAIRAIPEDYGLWSFGPIEMIVVS